MLKNQICPQCEEPFELTWQTEYIDGKFIHPTIVIRICPYGIMYSVSIRCPNCSYEEELE